MFTPLAFNKESIVTRGLVFHVDAADRTSYSPGSGVWNDLTGNGNNGTLINGPGFDGANGGSINFDGSDDYVNLGDTLDMGINSVTVTCWVNLTDSSMLSIRTPFSKSSARGLLGRYWFNIQSDISRLGKIRAGFAPSNSTAIVADGVTDIRNTGWRMITVVWERTDDLSVYLETSLDASISISSYSSTDMQSTDSLLIGSYSDSSGNPGDSTWQGNISNTLYYTRSLTPQEITQNYNALKGRFGL